MRGMRTIYVNIFWIVLGSGILIASMNGMLGDIYSGFGGGLIGVGIIQLLRAIQYRTNPEVREKYDIAMTDERNRYLRTKAWAWAGYLFVIIMALVTIGCMILSKMVLMQCASFAVCLLLVLYWGSYVYLSHKE